jgi:hypothetical protein
LRWGIEPGSLLLNHFTINVFPSNRKQHTFQTHLYFFQPRLCIYRTDNGCGWGVKTLDPIKSGQFAVEYVGEVITNEEAEERGKKYGEEI